MLNINSKLQTLFATGGTIIPARQSVARLTTVLFVLITAMFILTGCGLGSLIKAASSGNFPCNINPFQAKCYPDISAQASNAIKEITLTDEELNTFTEEQLAERRAEIDEQNAEIEKRNAMLLAERKKEEAARQEALAALAPVRKKLIDPVVAECTTNSVAEHCRNAFVWCSNFENTNSTECENAVGADTGLFACLTDPYRDECEDEPALKEEISGQVVVRDEETGDVMLDDNGEEVTIEKKVTLLENTIQARINYCRGEDNGVPNTVANAVLCDSTVREVCEDAENPAGVFDVFCKDAEDSIDKPYETERLRIATACRDDETPTVEEGCTSVVEFCNEKPFGNPNCDIPAFEFARTVRVDKCIVANTVDLINECRVEGANNDCFGDPFVHGKNGVDCTTEYNMGSAENVKTAQQSRATLCVNAFIAKTYTDVCGGASADESCVTDPFGGTCAEGLGDGHILAKQIRARYCIVGDRTADRLCLGAAREDCMQNPYHTDCAAFFGTEDQDTNAQRFRTNHCEAQITAGTVRTDDLCDSFLEDGIACKSNPFRKTPVVDCVNSKYDSARQTIVDQCRADSTIQGCTSNYINTCNSNPFSRFQVSATDDSLIPDEEACGALHFASTRLKFVNDCRAGTRTAGCGGTSSVITLCNSDPFATYRVGGEIDEDLCTPAYFDGARVAACTDATTAATEDCMDILTRPNTATWLDSFDTPLVALDTTTPKNQFLLGTANGIDTTGTNATATTLTIGDDATIGVGFFTANSRFYAGLFDGANLGAPLDNGTQAGTWTGNLRAVVGSTVGSALSMTLHVIYADAGATRVITAFVPDGNNHFLLDGTFTANGVISGTVNYGVFTGGVEGTPAGGRGTNGTLTGIIGQDGALGAFHSTATGSNGYAGGFVATKPAE